MLHYFFLCTMMLFVLESVFAYGCASTFIHYPNALPLLRIWHFRNASGIVVKDGVISPYANYVLFWLVPLLPFGLSIGFLMEYYGANGIQCVLSVATVGIVYAGFCFSVAGATSALARHGPFSFQLWRCSSQPAFSPNPPMSKSTNCCRTPTYINSTGPSEWTAANNIHIQ